MPAHHERRGCPRAARRQPSLRRLARSLGGGGGGQGIPNKSMPQPKVWWVVCALLPQVHLKAPQRPRPRPLAPRHNKRSTPLTPPLPPPPPHTHTFPPSLAQSRPASVSIAQSRPVPKKPRPQLKVSRHIFSPPLCLARWRVCVRVLRA